ncbi:MAG: hypothetical protein VCE91_11665 [Nitrospinota bacterium]
MFWEANLTQREIKKKLVAVVIWAAAFAFVEAAVVVYLRKLFYPEGFAFPLRSELIESILGVEIAREAATLVMLVSAAWLGARRPWVRFALFMVAFGVWDIFYYVWLWAVLGWPPSIFTMDVLFLIPIVWVGPVWSPVAVSAGLIGCGAAVALRVGGGGRYALDAPGWAAISASALIIVVSYLWEGPAAMRGEIPGPYPWWMFWPGLALGLGAFWRGWRSGG